MAIKVLRKYLESDFVSNEIKVMKTLKGSQYIVEYFRHEHFAEHGLIIIEMEYMAGGSLRDLIQNPEIEISSETASQIIHATCNALIEMNLKSISHNDIKPENILLKSLETPGIVKLGDFGLAQFMGSHMDIGQRGTKIYQAPEQRNSKKYSIESSVWSLGIILYELLERKHPYFNNVIDYNTFVEMTNANSLEKPYNFCSHAWLLYKAMMRYEFNKRVNLYEICTYPYITRKFDYNVYLQKDSILKEQDAKVKRFSNTMFFTTFLFHDMGCVDYSQSQNVVKLPPKNDKPASKVKLYSNNNNISSRKVVPITKKRSISMSRTTLKDFTRKK